jgi:hypothetical protein
MNPPLSHSPEPEKAWLDPDLQSLLNSLQAERKHKNVATPIRSRRTAQSQLSKIRFLKRTHPNSQDVIGQAFLRRFAIVLSWFCKTLLQGLIKSRVFSAGPCIAHYALTISKYDGGQPVCSVDCL